MPSSRIATIINVVAIGCLMNGAEIFIASHPVLRRRGRSEFPAGVWKLNGGAGLEAILAGDKQRARRPLDRS